MPRRAASGAPSAAPAAAHAAAPAAARTAAPAATTGRHRHHVYVVELDPAVMNERRFARANPDWDATRPCLYVGMTGLTPELRLARHRAGIKANRYVRRFGLRLLPALYAWANPMPYAAACEMEVELAIELREAGYAVWQG